jgi:transcriptional regulator with XRE-family HTH domain
MRHHTTVVQTHYDRYPELTELRTFRLENGLTYRALADKVGVAYRTLYGLLNEPSPRPYDRTLFKIRRFLESQRTPSRRRAITDREARV